MSVVTHDRHSSPTHPLTLLPLVLLFVVLGTGQRCSFTIWRGASRPFFAKPQQRALMAASTMPARVDARFVCLAAARSQPESNMAGLARLSGSLRGGTHHRAGKAELVEELTALTAYRR